MTENTPWSKDDLRFLKKWYSQRSNDELKIQMGRTPGAIRKKASLLHLRKSKKYLRANRLAGAGPARKAP